MASNGKASKTLSGTARKSAGRHGRTAAGSALTQAPIERRSESNKRSRGAQPSADELGLRAWKTTYQNRHEGKAKD
jgi:hypothetical protein